MALSESTPRALHGGWRPSISWRCVVKRFLPFILAIAGATLALGLTFLVLRTGVLPIRRAPGTEPKEASE